MLDEDVTSRRFVSTGPAWETWRELRKGRARTARYIPRIEHRGAGAKDLFTKRASEPGERVAHIQLSTSAHFALLASPCFSQVMLLWIRMDKNQVLEHGLWYKCWNSIVQNSEIHELFVGYLILDSGNFRQPSVVVRKNLCWMQIAMCFKFHPAGKLP